MTYLFSFIVILCDKALRSRGFCINTQNFKLWARDLGRRCRTIREDLRLNQAEFAELLGLITNNNTILSRFERGSVRLNAEVLYGLIDVAQKNGYSLLWLITGEGHRFVQRIVGGLEDVSDDELIREIAHRRLREPLTRYLDQILTALDKADKKTL